jgi:hypothetical protein
METELKTLLSSIQLGPAQSQGQITVVPLLWTGNGGPAYLTLGEALASSALTVTEVSQAGRVPELKVANPADQPVLLVDGEELLGAKQNRVLNTTILLKEHSETIVPVSCTEQGRWASVSPAFSDSHVHMPHRIRARKSSSVSESLASSASFLADQGEVWSEISELHCKVGSSSPTGAMRAAFEARRAELDKCVKVVIVVPRQHGLLVLLGGKVAGLDFVSREEAYGRLHAKLLQSYILEALAEPEPGSPGTATAEELAQAFLAEAGQCEERRFPSLGYGVDLRLKKPGLAGSALAHEERVVHCAFFRLAPEEARDRMASWRSRRWHMPAE